GRVLACPAGPALPCLACDGGWVLGGSHPWSACHPSVVSGPWDARRSVRATRLWGRRSNVGAYSDRSASRSSGCAVEPTPTCQVSATPLVTSAPSPPDSIREPLALLRLF